MRLTSVHITDFQSVRDSNPFEVGHVTCLVGKNETGKTAVLRALYRLNPINEGEGEFDVTDDYPRSEVADYEADVAAGRRQHAVAVKAAFALKEDDIAAVRAVLGPNCFEDDKPSVTLSKGYENLRTFHEFNVDEGAALKHPVEAAGLPAQLATSILQQTSAQAMLSTLSSGEATDASQRLQPVLEAIAENGVAHYAYSELLRPRVPKFLSFDEYYQMRGHENVEALKERVKTGQLERSDHPLLGLIELARLDLDQLTDPKRTEALLAKLEAAENLLTAKVLKYWSQNRHLRLKFDVRPAQPEDPEDMRRGMNVWGRVNDTKHMVSTAWVPAHAASSGSSRSWLGTRSFDARGRI